jgi:hypothetical protein
MADKLFRDYFNEKVTDTVLPANAKVLIQDGTGEPTQINAASISTGQLVKVTENGQTGYRLKDADPANYGDIGNDAVDLSISESVSTTKGAIGDYSHASGLSTTASGYASHAEGDTTTASEESAHAEGIGTTASGQASHSEGNETTASGQASHAEGSSAIASGSTSHAEGSSTFARSFAEHSGGTNGTDYTPQSATVFNLIDRLVNYGNGIDTSNRSDAYTLFKNGMQKFFTAALSTITNAVKGCVMLDDDVRLNIHDGDEFKPIPFTSEVATAAQGIKADNALPATATAADSAKLGGQLPAFYAALNGAAFTGSLEKTVVSGFSTISTLSGSIFNSLVADSAANSTGINFLDTAPFRFSTSTNKLGAGFSEKMRIQNGNLGINQTNPTEKLDVVGYGKFSGGFTRIIFDGTQSNAKSYSIVSGILGVANTGISIRNNTNSTNPFSIDGSDNGKFSGTVSASNGTLLAGTGTTNQLPKFTASGAVGNSQLFDNGTNVSILNSDSRLLGGDLTGRLNVGNSGITSFATFYGLNHPIKPNFIELINGGAIRLSIEPINGNVGINQTNPTEKLDVVGNGKFSGTVTAANFIGSGSGLSDVVKTRANKVVSASTYTILVTDTNEYLEFTNACVVTLPLSLAENLEFQGEQTGTGEVSFVSAATGTLNKFADFDNKTAGQFAPFGIRTKGSDVATLIGTLKLA